MSKEVLILKRNVTLVSILVCLLSGGFWLNHQYPDNGAAFAKESGKDPSEEVSEEVLIKNVDILIEKIESKLKEKKNLDIVTIGLSYQGKEIYIELNGTQQYVDQVKKGIKKDVNELAQDTIFKDYSIGVYKKIMSTDKLASENNGQLNKITLKIQENFKVEGYEEVENIRTEKQSKKLIVDVKTSIQKNDSTSINRGKEIEKEVRKSLTEVMSPLIAETIEVNVYNMNHDKIN